MSLYRRIGGGEPSSGPQMVTFQTEADKHSYTQAEIRAQDANYDGAAAFASASKLVTLSSVEIFQIGLAGINSSGTLTISNAVDVQVSLCTIQYNL